MPRHVTRRRTQYVELSGGRHTRPLRRQPGQSVPAGPSPPTLRIAHAERHAMHDNTGHDDASHRDADDHTNHHTSHHT
ncbi:MAG: hypothetical protein ACO3S5_05660, partial [Ilumatobacteraceae bacterium]